MAAVFAMIVGTGFYSYTIGNMTAIVASIDSENEEIQNKMSTFRKEQKKMNLDLSLVERIERHLANSIHTRKYGDTEKLL